jgi:ribosomal protein RSM22 (predicted rRNA methylase)
VVFCNFAKSVLRSEIAIISYEKITNKKKERGQENRDYVKQKE